MRTTTSISEKYGLKIGNVFHAGDGNMHPLIIFDANKPGDLELAEEAGADILVVASTVTSARHTSKSVRGLIFEELVESCEPDLTIPRQPDLVAGGFQFFAIVGSTLPCPG